jgi:hypothetical protein
MNIQFNSLNDMKKFAEYLSEILMQLGYNDKVMLVKEFSYNSFTTSSEYLGELRIILNELNRSNILTDDRVKFEVETAIQAINKAFGSSI